MPLGGHLPGDGGQATNTMPGTALASMKRTQPAWAQRHPNRWEHVQASK